jgi:hypothetical protein
MELIKRARIMQLTWMQLIADFMLGRKSKYAVASGFVLEAAAAGVDFSVAVGRGIEIYTYLSQHLN